MRTSSVLVLPIYLHSQTSVNSKMRLLRLSSGAHAPGWRVASGHLAVHQRLAAPRRLLSCCPPPCLSCQPPLRRSQGSGGLERQRPFPRRPCLPNFPDDENRISLSSPAYGVY